MKEMINTQITLNSKLHKTHYSNGQFAIFALNYNDEPLAELSIMCNSVELASDEFILKDYAENEKLAQKLFELELIIPTNRFVLIGSHLCLICQINS
ncbi:hypothetical protein LCGC14_1586570 [marine sediment metagenome]|uniref:Uncharacterized protein n=1 Tax=marine sediment metagenome TaxID=412755 RepID=A0A0F9IF76_9ZZZZ